MKKFISFAAFALLMSATAFSLSACGGDDDEDNNGGGSQEQAEEPLTLAGKAAVAVDLGLPSGTLWADRNVGADKAEAYGYYFAWGETLAKTDYSWSTYKWGTAEDQLTKYCNKSEKGKDGYTDAKNPEIGKELTELLKEDDAAYANWGGKWRIPTKAQIEELIANTDKIWVENYNDTGVNGRKFTNKKDASKYIFLPATGERDGTSSKNAGVGGYYWSRSLNTEDLGKADGLGFYMSYYVQSYGLNRGRGFTVRPVKP